MRQLADVVYRDDLRVKHHKKRKLEDLLEKHDAARRQLLPEVARSKSVHPMAALIIEHIFEA